MAAKALKQWALTEEETITSFETWKNNMIFTLSLDDTFAPFLKAGATWRKKTKTSLFRGFTGVGAANKAASLELMLGQIANFAPVISRNTIVKNSTSMNSIWEAIRLYYGIQSNGARLIDFVSIRSSPNKRHEALYQEMVAFIEDCLLTSDCGLKHHGEVVDEDEMSPTLENLVVLLWLQTLHPDLPARVKEHFGTELRQQTLASLRCEISQCLPSLLARLDEGQVPTVALSRPSTRRQARHTSTRECPICKAARRPDYDHYLTQCRYLPDSDKAVLLKKRKPKTRSITVDVPIPDHDDETDDDDDCSRQDEILESQPVASHRVDVKRSPQFKAFFRHNPVTITLDTGAETNLIKHSLAHFLGVKISRSSQTARQADGVTPLNIVGETSFTVSRDGIDLTLEALVVSDIDVDVLAGTPFMISNDVSVRPATGEITLKGIVTLRYDREVRPPSSHVVRCARACVLRAPESTTLWPGEYLEVEVPDPLATEHEVAVEPRQTSQHGSWPLPTLSSVVSGKIRLSNSSTEPIAITKNDHFCQVVPVCVSDDKGSSPSCTDSSVHRAVPSQTSSMDVCLDPSNMMPADVQQGFRQILKQYDDVFDPRYRGYNGYYGDIQAVVNMGPVLPPQRKGRIPQYSRDKLNELQAVFDKLEADGVFVRPEDTNIVVEYLNPSFLVRKPSGGHRLVTAFTDVARYCKPSPSTMPDVDSTLRTIAGWKYIIVTDLTSAFYQVPLSRESMKYCGVATPFKGIRVYQRAAMGMPGSETALEELMCRVLGSMIQEGSVAKLADDLYCGANTFEELLANFTRLLDALHKCELRLSGKKTIVCPKSTTILGWIWQQGTITASPHRITTLSQAPLPTTVKGMRSFIGAYKFLGRVLPGCATAVSPLDNAIAGMNSQDKLVATEELAENYRIAQAHLEQHKSITLPRSTDMLWIVTDGSVRSIGIGSTLYVSRGKQLRLAGFYSSKLQKHHDKWLPCEVEALGIAASIKHFSPYIIQSKHQCCVLTDSKPCVQAYERLSRGEFSHSPRIQTFLSTASRYQVSIRHLAGKVNVPSDFASRNAPECTHPTCQICNFIKQMNECVVQSISVSDILSGQAVPPFSNRPAWMSLQSDCSELRRTRAHLTQGTRPSRKVTNARNVKRYLNVVTLSHDGLLVVRNNNPLAPPSELIVVPQAVLPGLLTAIHINLDHPSAHQLKQVVDRKFFALNMAGAVKDVSEKCHTCASLRVIPKHIVSQTSSDPPERIGCSFAADVMKQHRQLVFVLREVVTSYTVSFLLNDEKQDSLRTALMCTCLELRPLDGPPAVVRVDPAPGFVALRKCPILLQNRITLELGCAKNPNKNPVAEKAVQELEEELLRAPIKDKAITHMKLAMATASLNTRIRSRGLSAREMLIQQEQFTHTQIPVSDQVLISKQHENRVTNHPYSERSKAPGPGIGRSNYELQQGDLVFLVSDRSKIHGRERYMVTSTDGDWCFVKKFSGPQLRNVSYKVKRSECEPLPMLYRPNPDVQPEPESSEAVPDDNTTECYTDDPPIPKPTPPTQPTVPDTLVTPLEDSDNKRASRPQRTRKSPAWLQDYYR